MKGLVKSRGKKPTGESASCPFLLPFAIIISTTYVGGKSGALRKKETFLPSYQGPGTGLSPRRKLRLGKVNEKQ